ncbi:hypothetical protein [Tessaracoccus oleiagri]|uniref:Transposase DDE domain-containing protein n=1 Tax=Tessaracoccus oleiagri TaxID=686624 RepID=A0A1G9HJ08_9ACTN|nr:hypothetical protein [Tessaracoccus oleiagri]SDL12865.1 hypothetical protein SAMN04488242_0341 [Tessaracoccus oleiagri]
MTGIDVAAWFAAGYGVALLLIAHGIDLLAKRSHTSFQDQRNGGFTYHKSHDAWLCPEDEWLFPRSFDPENRVMRYRGNPLVCNSCPVKDNCTESDDGREVQRLVDTWPASESARFHRGIACAVAVLGVAWPAATALTVDGWVDQVMLLGTALLIALGTIPLWSHLRRSPVDPNGVIFRSLDDTVAERAAAAAALARKRSNYASDRRADHAS